MRAIIDFHTHLFPEKVAARAVAGMYEYCKIPYRTEGDLVHLGQAMAREGVALSVNMPVCTNPAKVRSCNEFAAKVAATARFASFGCLHPAMKGGAAPVQKLGTHWAEDPQRLPGVLL